VRRVTARISFCWAWRCGAGGEEETEALVDGRKPLPTISRTNRRVELKGIKGG
jgi:hypothetical protein